MKYFHRTSLPPALVLDAARRFFGGRLTPAEETNRRRVYSGSFGRVSVSVRAEGGHYTLIEVGTDQVGESEIDRLARRFLAEVHHEVDPAHALRGAY
jgi:hypothetical protein